MTYSICPFLLCPFLQSKGPKSAGKVQTTRVGRRLWWMEARGGGMDILVCPRVCANLIMAARVNEEILANVNEGEAVGWLSNWLI